MRGGTTSVAVAIARTTRFVGTVLPVAGTSRCALLFVRAVPAAVRVKLKDLNIVHDMFFGALMCHKIRKLSKQLLSYPGRHLDLLYPLSDLSVANQNMFALSDDVI